MTNDVNDSVDTTQQQSDADIQTECPPIEQQTKSKLSAKSDPRSFRNVAKRLVIIISIGYLAILGTLAVRETSLVYPEEKYPNGIWEPSNFN